MYVSSPASFRCLIFWQRFLAYRTNKSELVGSRDFDDILRFRLHIDVFPLLLEARGFAVVGKHLDAPIEDLPAPE
jgi:hypothetical protein